MDARLFQSHDAQCVVEGAHAARLADAGAVSLVHRAATTAGLAPIFSPLTMCSDATSVEHMLFLAAAARNEAQALRAGSPPWRAGGREGRAALSGGGLREREAHKEASLLATRCLDPL